MMLFNRIVTALFCLFVLFPILWLIYAAFLPTTAMMNASLLTFGISLDNFAALRGTGILRAMGVSLLASGLTIALQLFFGLMMAYAIRSGLKLTALILVTLALPSELLLVPLYRELQVLGLLDTIFVLIVPFLASPFVIFLLLQSLWRLPWELVEAARIDGASEFGIVWRVLAPLLRPEMVAAAILSFAAHWNLVLYPKVMATDQRLYTVQVFLSELLRNRPLDWGLLGAAALITTLPLIILYIIFERRIITVFESSFK